MYCIYTNIYIYIYIMYVLPTTSTSCGTRVFSWRGGGIRSGIQGTPVVLETLNAGLDCGKRGDKNSHNSLTLWTVPVLQCLVFCSEVLEFFEEMGIWRFIRFDCLLLRVPEYVYIYIYAFVYLFTYTRRRKRAIGIHSESVRNRRFDTKEFF